MNMTEWIKNIIASERKKALPILSFPAVQLMGITVRQLISDSKLQAEAMKTVADRTDAYAALSLMDLSVEAEAFGAAVRFSDREVPSVYGCIAECYDDVKNLQVPEVGAARTGVCLDAVKRAVELIECRPVFAGVIGPFSLAGRLMDITEIMIKCYEEPEAVRLLLDKSAEFLINYIAEFKKAGASGVVMAEPLTGMLSPDMAAEFSEPFVRTIVDSVQTPDFCVIYHNCGNNTLLMSDSIIRTNAMAFHFGNAIELSDMLLKMPPDKLVMGNIDPVGILKDATVEKTEEETRRMLDACSGFPNFVPSSGCDIPPSASWDNINMFFETVTDFYTNR